MKEEIQWDPHVSIDCTSFAVKTKLIENIEGFRSRVWTDKFSVNSITNVIGEIIQIVLKSNELLNISYVS